MYDFVSQKWKKYFLSNGNRTLEVPMYLQYTVYTQPMQVNGYCWCSRTNIFFVLCRRIKSYRFKMIVFICGWTTTLTQKYYLGHLFRQMTASGLIQIFRVCGQSLFIWNVKYAKILPDIIYSTLITVYLDTILHSVHLSQEKTNRLDSLEIYLASVNSSFLKKSITQHASFQFQVMDTTGHGNASIYRTDSSGVR